MREHRWPIDFGQQPGPKCLREDYGQGPGHHSAGHAKKAWADQGPVCYDAIIFAELAVKFDTQKELEHRLSAFTCLPLLLNAAFQAGKAFEKYRRAGGKKARPLPDFFIGAHAYVAHLPLLTRDPRRVRTFFPSVRLITP